MPSLKILSDFDGVWTDQGLEAEEVRRCIVDEVAEISGIARERVAADLESLYGKILAQPHAWGWAPDGERISAYVDEDPLCLPSGLCLYLGRADDALARTYRAPILARFRSVAEFSEHCFRAAMTSYRDRHAPALVPHAREQLERVLALGAEIVVVSNSPGEKLVHWFGAAGIDAAEHGSPRVRLRGAAGKQTLGEGGEHIVVGGRPICVDRPRYRQAIEEEKPDLVIGDVFSLDLALPHVMRTQGHPAAPRSLVLRRHPHTPSWILDTKAEGAIDHLVDGFGDLVDLLRPP
jgi:hypothetical protein